MEKREGSRWPGGWLRLGLTGYGAERFFNMVRARGVELRGIRCQNGSWSFFVALEDFYGLKAPAKKAGVRLYILERQGWPFAAARLWRRRAYLAGAAVFFLLLYVLSLFVWRIELRGNEYFTDEYLTAYLAEHGVRTGVLKRNVSCQAVEEAIRGDFSEISWASAQLDGTCLTVRVRENEVELKGEKAQPSDAPCDLAAASDGVITHMAVRSGVPLVSVGDRVEKGQRLVAGLIPITDDAGQVTASHPVRADADITAKTDISVSRRVSRLQKAQAPTGKKSGGFYVRAFGHWLAYTRPVRGGKPRHTVRRERQLKLAGNFYLPVFWGSVTSREYDTYLKLLSGDSLEKEAARWAKGQMEKMEEKGIQILANDVKIKINGIQCRMELYLQAEEPIAVLAPLKGAEDGTENAGDAGQKQEAKDRRDQ